MSQLIKHLDNWKLNLSSPQAEPEPWDTRLYSAGMLNCFQVPTRSGSSATCSVQRAAKTSGQHKQTGFVPTICGITGISRVLYTPPHLLPPYDALSVSP